MSENSLSDHCQLLPDTMYSDTIVLRKAHLSDCPDFLETAKVCHYMEEWTGEKTPTLAEFEKTVTHGDLPPGGRRELFKIYAVIENISGLTLGFCDVYHGYPTKNIFYIGSLYLHRRIQKKGYGQIITKMLQSEAVKAGYTSMRLGVHLKNWPALRFWTQAGFRKITKICGDSIYSPTTYSVIELECKIT